MAEGSKASESQFLSKIEEISTDEPPSSKNAVNDECSR